MLRHHWTWLRRGEGMKRSIIVQGVVLTVASLFAPCSVCRAQTVWGYVLDSETLAPLPDACLEITFYDTLLVVEGSGGYGCRPRGIFLDGKGNVTGGAAVWAVL